MRKINALLFASALATGSAFAGQDSTVHGSVEASPPQMMSEQYIEPLGSENPEWLSLHEEEELSALEEGEVIYLVVPSESSEMPG